MGRLDLLIARLRVLLWQKVLRRPVAHLYHEGLVIESGNFDNVTWLGQPIWQNVLDLWTIQQAIAEVRPALLIEIGTNRAGSALFYANILDLLGHGRIVTVDILKQHELEHPRIEFLIGDSVSDEIVSQVQGHVDDVDGPVMVILDGDHGRDHVARELELYAPMVTPGSLLLSQDGAIDTLWMFSDTRPGPLPANRAFLAAHHEFEYARDLNERYVLTHHPLGWMRRVSPSS